MSNKIEQSNLYGIIMGLGTVISIILIPKSY